MKCLFRKKNMKIEIDGYPADMMKILLEINERVRNERFMEAVVTASCEKIQNAIEGDQHGTAIKKVSLMTALALPSVGAKS